MGGREAGTSHLTERRDGKGGVGSERCGKNVWMGASEFPTELEGSAKSYITRFRELRNPGKKFSKFQRKRKGTLSAHGTRIPHEGVGEQKGIPGTRIST